MDLPDSTDTSISLNYQYEIAAGNFEVTIDISNYTPDVTTNGFTVTMNFAGTDPNADHVNISMRQLNATPTYRVTGSYEKNNEGNNQWDADDVGTIPSKYKIKRSTDTLSVEYYNGSWTELGNVDFGAHSGNMKEVWISAADVSSRGGSVDFDNLTFISGCPTGGDKAWTTTTTTTTTTTCTTTTTEPPP